MPPGTKEAKLRQRAARRERQLGTFCGRGFSGINKTYRKRPYPNFYMALQSCAELEAKGEAKVNPIYIYHCGGCDGIHIGHLAAGESVLMYEGVSVNIREEQKCPPSAS